ncbi:DUF3320 domain-containing protein [Spiribacter onubensis]|uniref:DUF3320 domain-containing protein n=1 Tax=Spiribacter onubensis TaxID=3122420 RepID=A0ABV3S7E5_9GAMM
MSGRRLGSFAAAVALHENLLRRPDPDATETRLHPGRLDLPSSWTPDLLPLSAYRAADPAALGLGGFDDFHAIPEDVLEAAIKAVVDVEGPVHFDVLADRLLEGAGVGRLGSRIRERIEVRLEALSAGAGAASSLQLDDGLIAWPRQLLSPPYRDWREAPEKTRQLDYVSDAELMLVLFRAVLDDACRDREVAMNDGIHAIGFIRLTDNVRARLQAPLARLLASGWMVEEADGLVAQLVT